MPTFRQLPALLAVAISLVALDRPCSAADQPYPLAKGPLEKIDLDAKQLVVKTKTGSRTFGYTERTYFFRGKQKISAEELHVGEIVALRFTTGPNGEKLIQRLKAAPVSPPAPNAAPAPPARSLRPMKKVLVPLAPGFEEIEAITVIDILRRAGVTVVVAGTQPGPITAARQTRHLPDCTLDDVRADELDLIVLPGGQPGATNLRQDPRIKQIIATLRAHNRPVAAICAAPTVLAAAGVLADRTATSHPTVRAEVAAAARAVSDDRVVVDGPIITSQAAGTAMEFAFKLVELLCGPDKAAEINRSVLARLK